MYSKYSISVLYIFLFSFHVFGKASAEWQHSIIENKLSPTAYIFAPPILQSELTTVYYCGNYTASSGEQFYCKNPFLVLHSDYVTSCNFAEINLTQDQKMSCFPSGYPMRLFSRIASGVLDWGHRIYNYFFDVSLLNPGVFELSVAHYNLEVSCFNIAQKPDRTLFLDAYKKALSSSDNDLVLYGFSRGAATIFMFMVNEYKSQKSKKVKAVVLGGCFDSVRNLFENKSQLIPGITLSGRLYRWVERTFPSFGYNREEPIDCAGSFPQDVPVLLIASKWDLVVPYKSVVSLYKKLKETGHQNVYLLMLDNAAHGAHFLNNKKDREKYLYTVHAFYKKYGLSHIAEYAEKGEQLLAQC